MPITLRDKIWYLDTQIGDKRVRRSLNTGNKQEAKRRAIALEIELMKGQATSEEQSIKSAKEQPAPEESSNPRDELIEQYQPKYSEDEFKHWFRIFNAMNGVFPWQYTNARKDHIDEFGAPIKEGETYFSRNRGGAFDNVERLSRRSMDTLVFTMLDRNPLLEAVGKHSQEAQMAEMRKAAEAISKLCP